MAVDFARLMGVGELTAFHRAREPFTRTVPAAVTAVLALSLVLFERKEMTIDRLKALAHGLFDRSDEGKQIVVEKLMKLDDAHFGETGRSVSVKAASGINSGNEALRISLACFFIRVQDDRGRRILG
jgi:hypothetical protein